MWVEWGSKCCVVAETTTTATAATVTSFRWHKMSLGDMWRQQKMKKVFGETFAYKSFDILEQSNWICFLNFYLQSTQCKQYGKALSMYLWTKNEHIHALIDVCVCVFCFQRTMMETLTCTWWHSSNELSVNTQNKENDVQRRGKNEMKWRKRENGRENSCWMLCGNAKQYPRFVHSNRERWALSEREHTPYMQSRHRIGCRALAYASMNAKLPLYC